MLRKKEEAQTKQDNILGAPFKLSLKFQMSLFHNVT